MTAAEMPPATTTGSQVRLPGGIVRLSPLVEVRSGLGGPAPGGERNSFNPAASSPAPSRASSQSPTPKPTSSSPAPSSPRAPFGKSAPSPVSALGPTPVATDSGSGHQAVGLAPAATEDRGGISWEQLTSDTDNPTARADTTIHGPRSHVSTLGQIRQHPYFWYFVAAGVFFLVLLIGVLWGMFRGSPRRRGRVRRSRHRSSGQRCGAGSTPASSPSRPCGGGWTGSVPGSAGSSPRGGASPPSWAIGRLALTCSIRAPRCWPGRIPSASIPSATIWITDLDQRN